MASGLRGSLGAWLAVALLAQEQKPQDAKPQESKPSETSARQQDFMKELKGLVELQDTRAILKLARQEAEVAEAVIDLHCMKFCEVGDAKELDPVRMLGEVIDGDWGSKRYSLRFTYLAGLDPAGRKSWLTMRGDLQAAMLSFGNANDRKEPADYRAAVSDLDRVVDESLKLKDLETAAYARYHLGLCRDALGDYPEAFKAFDVAMDEWLAAGRPKERMYNYMAERRRTLIEKGFGTAPAPATPDGQKPARTNDLTSYKAGTSWQDWTTEYREMQSPDQLPSISPWCTDHILLWREFTFTEGTHPIGLLTQVEPFGSPLSIVREKSNGSIDLDGDKKGDVPIKVVDGKPTLATLKKADGKETREYALWLVTGGQTQWFGSKMNFTTRGGYRSACYRECKSLLGETWILLDDNCNGKFGDWSEVRDNLTRNYPTWIDDDGLIVGKGRAPIPCSEVVQVGGKWYHFKVADPSGKRLQTRELDIDSGLVELHWNGPVPPKLLVLAEQEFFKGAFFDVAGGKPVALPVGRYRIAYGRIESGKAGQLKQAWIFNGDAPEILVKAGATFALEMGGPYKIDFETKDDGKSLTIKGRSLVVKEKRGAIVARIFDEILYPEVTLKGESGSTVGGPPKPMTRIDQATFFKEPEAEWFPGDFVAAKPDKAKWQAQLNLKKHNLLGGPFTSDWK